MCQFETVRGLIPGELGSGYRSDRLTRERQLLVLYLVHSRQYKNRELAQLFKRDRSTVSRWLTRAAELNRNDPGFRRKFEEAQRALSKC